MWCMTQLPPKAMLSHAGMGADQLLFMCPQGPRDIYLGISGAVFGTIPTAFLYFSTYEWCKERLSERGHSQVCLRFSHHLVWTWCNGSVSAVPSGLILVQRSQRTAPTCAQHEVTETLLNASAPYCYLLWTDV